MWCLLTRCTSPSPEGDHSWAAPCTCIDRKRAITTFSTRLTPARVISTALRPLHGCRYSSSHTDVLGMTVELRTPSRARISISASLAPGASHPRSAAQFCRRFRTQSLSSRTLSPLTGPGPRHRRDDAPNTSCSPTPSVITAGYSATSDRDTSSPCSWHSFIGALTLHACMGSHPQSHCPHQWRRGTLPSSSSAAGTAYTAPSSGPSPACIACVKRQTRAASTLAFHEESTPALSSSRARSLSASSRRPMHSQARFLPARPWLIARADPRAPARDDTRVKAPKKTRRATHRSGSRTGRPRRPPRSATPS